MKACSSVAFKADADAWMVFAQKRITLSPSSNEVKYIVSEVTLSWLLAGQHLDLI